MRPVAILTDSSSALPEALQQQFAITVLPHSFQIEGREYTEGVNIHEHELKAMIQSNPGRATTAAVNPNLLVNAFNNAIANGQHALFVSLSSQFSCTHQNGLIARDLCSRPDCVHVYDGRELGFNLGKLAIAAAQLVDKGLPLPSVFSQLDAFRANRLSALWVNELEALVRSGRAAPVLSRFNSVLDLHPVLRLSHDGNANLVRLTRTEAQGIEVISGLLGQRGMLPGEVVCIGHMDNPDGANRLLARIRQILGDVPAFLLNGGNLFYVHLGNGSLSLSV